MNKREIKKTWDSICGQYGNMMWIHPDKKENGFYSRILSREVVVPEESFNNPDVWDLFALLHEIGHVMTNTNKMKRSEQEYLATVWAIKKAKEIGFNIPAEYIKIYQNYIWKWRETGLKLGGKKVLSKEELTLVY